MGTQVNMHEAKSQLSALVERVLAGEQVTIARAGTPVVDLVVHRSASPVFGLLKGAYEYDAKAFDDADEEIREMFYGADA
ncbi:type II toxin-antitoxin system Phd/YefM family antitoxin [Microbacterium suwonense]|uniref:Antitoxin n=1 Tax=Microbacterium suwonense TaxID=683047 RepID=A0ABN6X570_9MICO|nr:type II toxin-antitoxin system prevent-host-death family antitoxin [Microbacterium suwonense]BDZ39839.1 hypothetical protein GCM10025863_24530 [Microbacterium suwonense]